MKAHQVIFLRNNPEPPWLCIFCLRQITIRGRSALGLNIHHKDDDHSNNDPENLVAAHKRCHTMHHMAQRTLEDQERINRKLDGRPIGRDRMRESARNRHNRFPSNQSSR